MSEDATLSEDALATLVAYVEERLAVLANKRADLREQLNACDAAEAELSRLRRVLTQARQAGQQ